MARKTDILYADELAEAVNDAVSGCFGVIVKTVAALTATLALVLFLIKASQNLLAEL